MDPLAICNPALAKLPAAPIADIDEASLEARECRRLYPVAVATMLEGPHEWSWAKRRATLAETTNDRDDEWLYAYALPADAATVIRVLPDFEGLGLGLPIPLEGDPFSETWAVSALTGLETSYVLDSGVIYSNEQNAVIEYVLKDISEIDIPQMVANALSIELASLLVIPLKKDSGREDALLRQAEVAWERAIADDRNRQPQTYGDTVPEAIAARHGSI